ncbi:MAG: hypothetical protein ACT4QF_06360 [Sporichthyaceae bacterium]
MNRHLDRRGRVALAAALLAPAVLLGASTTAGAAPAPAGAGHLPTAAATDDPDGQWWDYDRSSRSASPGAGEDATGAPQGRPDSGRDAQAQGFADEDGLEEDRDLDERPVDSLGPQRQSSERAPERTSRSEEDSAADRPTAPKGSAARDADEEFRVETPNEKFDDGAARARAGEKSEAPTDRSARQKAEDEVLAKEAEAAGLAPAAPAPPAAKSESESTAEPKAKAKAKAKSKAKPAAESAKKGKKDKKRQ